MDWIYLLKSTKYTADQDKASFLKWEEGKATTAETIKAFRLHNEIPDWVEINEYLFEQWLRRLGYWRIKWVEKQQKSK